MGRGVADSKRVSRGHTVYMICRPLEGEGVVSEGLSLQVGSPREPALGALRHSGVIRLHPGDPTPSGPLLGPVWSRAPGAHAHGNTERQVVDGLRTEVCGQQKQSNDPSNNQHNLNMPTTGRR